MRPILFALICAGSLNSLSLAAAREKASKVSQETIVANNGLDDDGEAQWGHIQLQHDLSKGFEFFRAMFGGPFPCEYKPLFVLPDDEYLCEEIPDENIIESITGRLVIVNRGECSFNDKAIVAQKAGAAGIIVANSAPGLMRMPPGILKQRKNVKVSIPAVMISTASAKVLKAVLQREKNPNARITGQRRVKGKTVRIGTCDVAATQISADGTQISSSAEDALEKRELEGGIIYPRDNDKPTSSREFLTAMFGGPLPREARRIVVANPGTSCADISQDGRAENALVLTYRGECMFTTKALNAEAAGAIGLIVVNTVENEVSRMFGAEEEAVRVTIPVVMISKDAGESIAKLISSNPDAEFMMKHTAVSSTEWSQVGKYSKFTEWPTDETKRKLVYEKLVSLHNPEVSEDGHWERFEIVKKGYSTAEENFGEMTMEV